MTLRIEIEIDDFDPNAKGTQKCGAHGQYRRVEDIWMSPDREI
jgi:hypothetical protein